MADNVVITDLSKFPIRHIFPSAKDQLVENIRWAGRAVSREPRASGHDNINHMIYVPQLPSPPISISITSQQFWNKYHCTMLFTHKYLCGCLISLNRVHRHH